MSDEELLAAVIGAPRVVGSALLAEVGTIAAISRASARELARIRGVGASRGARLAAAFELGRRALSAMPRRDPMIGPADVARHLSPRIAGLQQEVFFALGLDVRNGL